MRTNLYYNHAESKYIRFSCDRIGSLQNLWRGPRHSISVLLPYGVRSTNNRSKLEIRQTSVTVVIDENAGLVTMVIGEAETIERKHLLHSSFRVWHGSREYSQDLQIPPITWEVDVIRQVKLQRRTH